MFSIGLWRGDYSNDSDLKEDYEFKNGLRDGDLLYFSLEKVNLKEPYFLLVKGESS